jgi:hypothetical protein
VWLITSNLGEAKMQAALVIRWAIPQPGREKAALEYGAEAAAFWAARAQEGKCTVPEMFLSYGLGAFWMVKGEEGSLRSIFDSDEGQDLIMKAGLLLSDLQIGFYTAADSTDTYLARYARTIDLVV